MNKANQSRQDRRNQRRRRVRAKISGTAERPRLNIFRSLRGMNAQLIDDISGKVLVSVNNKKDSSAKIEVGDRKGKIAVAYKLGQVLAERAKENKISAVVFDRAGYPYHGRVEALAEGARDGGLQF